MLDESTGALALVVDKWKETELEKGHKLVEYAGRGLGIPDDDTEPGAVGSYVGKYEYWPDHWNGAGTGTETFKDEVRQITPGRRARPSAKTPTNIPVALANTKASVAAALTQHTKASVAAALTHRAPSKAANTKTR